MRGKTLTLGSPTFEEELAAHLQRRLSMVSVVLAVAVAAMFVAPVGLWLLVYGAALTWFFFQTPVLLLYLAGLAALLLLSWRLRRKPLSLAALRWIDALMLLWALGVTIAGYTQMHYTDYPFFFALILLLVVARSVVVPSTGRRTLLLAAPLAVVLPLLHLILGPPKMPDGTQLSTVIYLMENSLYQVLLLICIGVATLASRMSFSLRREFHDAHRLGIFVLQEKIGEGAMGEVYRASHELLKRPTAVKLLRPEITGSRMQKRFEHEVQLTSALTHPNTISIYDYGHTADGLFFYAMEYLDGADLERIVERTGRMAAGRVAHMLVQVCGALEEAHQRGLVHRDIKPSNIFLCRGLWEPDTAKLLDFGLVKDLGGVDPDLTQAGAFLGTPNYAAPEMFLGGSITPAADLYSLGAVA
jgi:serine/threonine-protein kinase